MQLKKSSKGQFVLKFYKQSKEMRTLFNIKTMNSTVELKFDIFFDIEQIKPTSDD